MTTLYIAGPMRGLPRYNYDAFSLAARDLREVGYTVISPHELDVDYGDLPGFDVNVPGSFTPAHFHAAMRRDLTVIANDVDGVATLDGWHNSTGAMHEVYVARAVGLPVQRIGRWLDTSFA